jgi:hypothetical protein
MTCYGQRASYFAAEQKGSGYEWQVEVGATPSPDVAALALHGLSHDVCNMRLEGQSSQFATGTR